VLVHEIASRWRKSMLSNVTRAVGAGCLQCASLILHSSWNMYGSLHRFWPLTVVGEPSMRTTE
jgi:hypothetical protein